MRTTLKWLLLLGVLYLVVSWIGRPKSPAAASETSPSALVTPETPSYVPPIPESRTRNYGYGSSKSGHEAGYEWAEQHDIDDADDCDTAGEHSNSPSFAEGCADYVRENAPSWSDDDSED